MNVKDLRAALAGLDDDLVVIGYTEDGGDPTPFEVDQAKQEWVDRTRLDDGRPVIKIGQGEGLALVLYLSSDF